jgi:hypothetical protein
MKMFALYFENEIKPIDLIDLVERRATQIELHKAMVVLLGLYGCGNWEIP